MGEEFREKKENIITSIIQSNFFTYNYLRVYIGRI
jgi:hypothetical protein